jgi:protein gp37
VADRTHIEWTDATWNPITGCSVVSPGCTNCYAMKLAGTRLKHHPSRAGLTNETKAGPVWNGQVRFNREWLDQPLRWKKPRMIFVCAHGDLFHESVPDTWIDEVLAVMAMSPRHTFQVLTKRPERMRTYLSASDLVERLADAVLGAHDPEEPLAGHRSGVAWLDGRGSSWGVTRAVQGLAASVHPWPLPNVWLGVSVEDQRRTEERIPILLDTPAAVRWVSAEPLLGPIDLMEIIPNPIIYNSVHGMERLLDWVVAGGESGRDARPMHPDWARSLRDQCAAAGVAFLFKQWGSFRPCTPKELTSAYGATRVTDATSSPAFMLPASKGRAGRSLDGVIHDDFPEVRHG